ncbi:hypothetical protein HQ520_07530 [bacterium]|nr:hypothetical protein [bacterium]
MRVEQRPSILRVLDGLVDRGILSEKQRRLFARKPARGHEAVRCARILSLSPWIRSGEDRNR